LAGYLAGAIATGTLMAVYLANSGGAWDNAKKLVEDGHHGGKGSAAHEATVIGDTVGDPFKDTAGPAINPLIKVMNLVSVLVAPAIVAMSVGAEANDRLRYSIAGGATLVIVVAVWFSKRRAVALDSYDPGATAPPATAIEPVPTIDAPAEQTTGEQTAEQTTVRKSPTT
jgi:K(+)-stimulated pyrophosphate-energized sodium pump